MEVNVIRIGGTTRLTITIPKGEEVPFPLMEYTDPTEYNHMVTAMKIMALEQHLERLSTIKQPTTRDLKELMAIKRELAKLIDGCVCDDCKARMEAESKDDVNKEVIQFKPDQMN